MLKFLSFFLGFDYLVILKRNLTSKRDNEIFFLKDMSIKKKIPF